MSRQSRASAGIAARRDYIVEQLARIEACCEIRPVVAPDHPSEIAVLINQSFGIHVLDAANLAGTEHLLISEDMYYRQFAEASCAAKGLWLQEVFSFAHESGLIDHQRYVDLVVRLAWRRHGHLALNSGTMLAVLRDGTEQGLENFKSVADFIGTRNAELRSHIKVSTEFLNQLWHDFGRYDLRRMQATSTLLERIIRFRTGDWALVLAFVKRGCSPVVQEYIDRWIAGHFLSASAVSDAAAEIENVARDLRGHRDVRRTPNKALASRANKSARRRRRS